MNRTSTHWTRARAGAALLLTGAMAFTAGCKDSSPNNPPAPLDPTALAGSYTLTQYSFTPAAAIIGTVNVLSDTLVVANTSLQLTQASKFVFSYQIEGTTASDAVLGGFTTGISDLQLTPDAGQNAQLNRLLFPASLRFDRASDGSLTSRTTDTVQVNLQAYNATKYRSLTSQRGVLHIKFTKR